MPELREGEGTGQGRAKAGSSLDGVVPDLHRPVRATGHENLGVEWIPYHGVHCHVVSIIGVQELAGVGFGALWQPFRVVNSGRLGSTMREKSAAIFPRGP